VFAPLALLSGVVGSFLGALAVTLSASVVLSLVVSVTVVPLVAARLLKPRKTPAAPAAPAADAEAPARGLAAAYGRLLARVVRHPVLSVIAVLLLAAGGVLAARATTTGFLPQMDEGAMVVDFVLPPGTSLEETDRLSR